MPMSSLAGIILAGMHFGIQLDFSLNYYFGISCELSTDIFWFPLFLRLSSNSDIANKINAEILTKPEIATLAELFSYIKLETAKVQ